MTRMARQQKAQWRARIALSDGLLMVVILDAVVQPLQLVYRVVKALEDGSPERGKWPR
jgi:hypothetical protein